MYGDSPLLLSASYEYRHVTLLFSKIRPPCASQRIMGSIVFGGHCLKLRFLKYESCKWYSNYYMYTISHARYVQNLIVSDVEIDVLVTIRPRSSLGSLPISSRLYDGMVSREGCNMQLMGWCSLHDPINAISSSVDSCNMARVG